jgi:hypothetical protein
MDHMKKTEDKADFTVAFRTGRIWEYDMVVNTLKDNGIPFQSFEESSSGLRLAMPLRPTPGPGVWWGISVPKQHLEKVNSLLSELPIDVTTEPDIWHFSSSGKVKLGLKIYAWIALALLAVSFLYGVVDFIIQEKKKKVELKDDYNHPSTTTAK